MSNLQDIASAPRIAYYARRSRELGKLAACMQGSDAANALAEKTAADAAIFSLLEKTAYRLQETFEALKSPLLKGLGYGAGAAVPLGLAGSYLINKGEDSARNVALPAAGILGAGAGLMALSNLYGDGHNASAHGNRKEAAMDSITTGMAAFGVASKLRDVVASTTDPELSKLASDTLSVALAHVADVVGDLVL